MTEREVVTLRDYIDSRLDEQRAYFEAKIAAIDKATCESTESLNKRLEGMNEFRSALKDQNATFMPRTEYAIQHEKLSEDLKAARNALDSDIRILRESKATLEGKASMTSVFVGYVLTVIALLIAAVALWH